MWIRGLGLYTLVFLVVQLTACAPRKVTIKTSPGFNPSAINTIAILPFQALTTPQQPTSVPLETISAPEEVRSQFRFPTPGGLGAKADPITVSGLAAQKITRMVHAALENRQGVKVLPHDQVKQALPEVDPDGPPLKMSERVKRVGSNLKVDAVLVGLVRMYRERVGTKIGATPAAVGFEVHLVNRDCSMDRGIL